MAGPKAQPELARTRAFGALPDGADRRRTARALQPPAVTLNLSVTIIRRDPEALQVILSTCGKQAVLSAGAHVVPSIREPQLARRLRSTALLS